MWSRKTRSSPFIWVAFSGIKIVFKGRQLAIDSKQLEEFLSWRWFRILRTQIQVSLTFWWVCFSQKLTDVNGNRVHKEGSTSVLRAECFGSVAHNSIKRGKFPDSIHFYSVYVSKKQASQTQTELLLKKSYTADCQRGYVYEATFFPSLFFFFFCILFGWCVCLFIKFICERSSQFSTSPDVVKYDSFHAIHFLICYIKKMFLYRIPNYCPLWAQLVTAHQGPRFLRINPY